MNFNFNISTKGEQTQRQTMESQSSPKQNTRHDLKMTEQPRKRRIIGDILLNEIQGDEQHEVDTNELDSHYNRRRNEPL